jgi:hypothetical protein
MLSSPPTRRVARAKLLFLVAAFVSFVLSVTLFFITGDERTGIFVGLWVPSILSFGALIFAAEAIR